MNHSDEILSILREEIEQYDNRTRCDETGTVIEVGDGIATVYGLNRAVYGELVQFDTGVHGIVLDLKRDSVGVVLLGSEDGLHEGSAVSRTGRAADVPVGDAMIGRTVNALGEPIDGLGPIETTERRPIEREASGVVSREPVNQPMQTGILAIDSMVPIGRGQRELIIGDRQTGKTSIAIDTILNQKGQDMICIYVAIGQKASTVARLRGTLEKYGAYFAERDIRVDGEFMFTVQDPTIARARDIADIFIRLFREGQLDDVYVVYTEMVTPMRLEPRVQKLLPLDIDAFPWEPRPSEHGPYHQMVQYVPSADRVLEHLVPGYVKGELFGALVESFCAEQNARMTAMDSATDNARDMLKSLSLHYNRARQSAITQEITEIVGGTQGSAAETPQPRRPIPTRTVRFLADGRRA